MLPYKTQDYATYMIGRITKRRREDGKQVAMIARAMMNAMISPFKLKPSLPSHN